jgi:hypothetical protein
MMIQLKTLLSLEVRHGYYGGVCRDVGFIVPQDVAGLMSRAGLSVKIIDGVLHVFYRADDAGAPVVTAAGKTVRIGLGVRDPQFANITEAFDPASGALFYRNSAAASALDAPPVRVAFAGRSFSRPLARGARPVTVTFKDLAGRALHAETVTRDDRTAVSFDLTRAAPGAFTLEEAYPDGVTSTSHYVDPDLSQQGAFGVVEIDVDPTFYASAPRFTVPFEARRETLRYYVVVKGFSNGDVDQLTVQDNGLGGPDAVTFERVPPEQLTTDEKSRTEQLGGDGAKVLLFRSVAAVARRQTGAKRIQLMRSTEALIEHLPQPGKDRGAANLIIHLSKSKP